MNKKEYKKFTKRILAGASSGIAIGILLVGTSHVFAETTDYSGNAYEQNSAKVGMHMMHRWNSDTKAGKIAKQLGLDETQVKAGIKSGKSMKQILQDHGIVPGQLQKAFQTHKKLKK